MKMTSLISGLILNFQLLMIRIRYNALGTKTKLWWHRLWIRRNEFHKSLSLDPHVLITMTKEQQEKYLNDLVKRRQKAHERDLKRDEAIS